ncbi:hypothetical protein FOQG_00768 [Fusarium oxysporum f. sp. raphani 54005]|uniref:Uncharacterized protein n=6 Tax=Fusarium oxysporum TaxID=5507 RepID=X0DB31_FUSOX|nr:hypothetical protein FOVG_02810 [Fusarium oxysporum f. sp. pisi HDV247]EXL00749.1 hypothetical protein FOQG_00768 [Fusarium oxysporum f. sp. raphani 54005]EXL61863.1 hypothetical protein FOCG_00779 [Fusarium oxysporum f. sp. radicis-lycopersici 26381]EXM36742.1 hypothetical protein FOTG_00750 [Fusarium oxysporum f. sp. vasinfectum 25433]KAG7436304.1 hypothetical protein Forpi1262_v003024 [Fusarium oxysporum f. sp. raphani]KAH7229253.1 hypothetical protein BKA60DRAFT_21653 [Fusarium oxysporu
MENDIPTIQVPDGRSSRRDRLMGKLFGAKDRKGEEARSAANVESFLHSSSDNLTITNPPPPPPPSSLPKLAKLDTTSISRYPQALGLNHAAQQNRPLVAGRPDTTKSPRRSPRPNKKGLTVRFDDTAPEIIGEGGDESEIPTQEISKRKVARPKQQPQQPQSSQPPQPPAHRRAPMPPGRPPPPDSAASGSPVDDFRPKPLSRTQTGFSSIYTPDSDEESEAGLDRNSKSDELVSPVSAQQHSLSPGRPIGARFLGPAARQDENRRSYIEIHSAQQREAEGRAFAEAARVASATSASSHNWDDPHSATPLSSSPIESRRRGPPSPEAQVSKPSLEYSPAASLHSNSSSYSPPAPPAAVPASAPSLSGSPSGAQAPAPTAVSATSTPTSEVNQLSRQPSIAPQRAPPMMASRALSVRVADGTSAAAEQALETFTSRTSHLFELFRLHAESVKPLSTCSLIEFGRGALWWFLKGRMGLEVAIRERPNSPQGQMQNDRDRQQAYANLAKAFWLCELVIPEIAQAQGIEIDAEVDDVSTSLVSALKKLAMSMKRNGFLPPEDAFLPQSIDKSIWVEYPPLSQDMIALLSGNWASGLTAMTSPMSKLRLLDSLPVGDTTDNFNYGRVPADAYLMEQGHEDQKLYFPCLLSMVRPQKSTGLVFILASQNGHVQLVIQENKNVGPIWDDVRWRKETCTVDIRLRRGFMLTIQLVQQDFRTLWNMYDFGSKVNNSLYPRSDESMVFRSTLRSFQVMDADPNYRQFPKEPTPYCEISLFEKLYKENGPAATRTWHLGFRIAVVTGPKTRTLSGVQHVYSPAQPVQFGFFRGDGDAPSLAIKYENGKSKGRMVMVFSDDKARIKFHSILTGTALDHDEKIYSDVPLKNFSVAQSLREPLGMAPFSRMPWKAVRVVNDEYGGEMPPTVLADHLKVVIDYQNGNVADRINVAPGELRVRLEVSNAKVFRVLRQPQKDMTISVSEAQVPKELPRNMSDALQLLRHNQTIRTFEFNNLKDLHDFQYAMTGFEVIFDALAVTFAIQRRRMVVPIHKKWEAGYTRIQVIRQEDKQLQLLAFFEDFHHGHCMNFLLKGTDVYESVQRSSKCGIKFVDAKFPLPRLPADKDGDYDDMAFVCLDLPDLPGEHDDISILFENESDRDALAQCLPAPIKGSKKK